MGVGEPLERVRIAGRPDDLEPRVAEQARHALPQEHLVIGDHDPHGSSARTVTRPRRSSIRMSPPTAPTRSTSPRDVVPEPAERVRAVRAPLT